MKSTNPPLSIGGEEGEENEEDQDKAKLSSIQNIIPLYDKFYILANKKGGKLGFFLLSIDANNPSAPPDYLISWSNKLDIGCCDMQIMKEDGAHESIVVSYKMIGINTYNIFVIDL